MKPRAGNVLFRFWQQDNRFPTIWKRRPRKKSAGSLRVRPSPHEAREQRHERRDKNGNQREAAGGRARPDRRLRATPAQRPGARGADPGASAAGAADRTADSRTPAGKRPSGGSDLHRHRRADRRHRPLRSLAEREAQDVRGIQDPGRDSGQPARPGLGAAPAAQARQADRSSHRRRRAKAAPRADRRGDRPGTGPDNRGISRLAGRFARPYAGQPGNVGKRRRGPRLIEICRRRRGVLALAHRGAERTPETAGLGHRQMPDIEKTVLSLYYHEELTLREISKIVNLHESRISQLKTQAILRLRAFMEKSWPGPRGA